MFIKIYRLDEHDHLVQPGETYVVSNEQEACQLAEMTAAIHRCRVDVVTANKPVTTCAPGEKATVNPDYYRGNE